MVKLRTEPTTKDTEKFLSEMSDKTYGVDERIERITISVEGELYDVCDEIVRLRKRNKKENRTMSAYIREAILYYQLNHKN